MVWGNTLGLAVALALLTHAAPGTAAERQKPLGVVELFTSQGCNSCPPADAVFGDLAREGKVVALAYHVNYWDYLGWRDTLSSVDATQRQYDYMSALGTQSVYTPQAVVNGRAHMNAARRGEVESALRSMAQGNTGLQVGVSATRSGDLSSSRRMLRRNRSARRMFCLSISMGCGPWPSPAARTPAAR